MSKPNDHSNSSASFKWGKPKAVKVQQARLVNVSFTTSGNAASALFDDLKAELNGEGGGLHAVSLATFQLPVAADLKKGFLGFLIYVRGAASMSAKGRVSLVVSVNGCAEVAKLNIVDGASADVQILHEQFVVEQRGAAESNPSVPPLEPVLVTLTLVAKRATVEDSALLTVDSIDLTACFG